jgi:hypothetical protein
MENYEPPSFIERLKAQINEERCRYRDALISGKEFLELKLIKNNIEKLELRLQQILKILHEYIPQRSAVYDI